MNPQTKPNPSTTVLFGKEAQAAVYAGVEEVAEAVATTLGPSGKNVLIDKGYETSIIHDGVNVSLVINPKEPFKRHGAAIIQEATKRMRDLVGDGTTVCCILTKAILDKTLEITASGVNPMSLRPQLETGAKKVIAAIQKNAIPITTLEQKKQIARISAEDTTLGDLVAQTVHDTGEDGVITIEESKGSETTVEHQEGMQIDHGLVHYMLMTDPQRQVAILEDAMVLVTDLPLNNLLDCGKFIENQIFNKGYKKCLFISPEIGGDFLNVLVGSKISGQFLGLAMRAPGIGSMQLDALSDICALTGATLVTKEAGHTLNEMTFDVLGQVKKVQQTKTATILIGGKGHREDVLARIQTAKEQLKDETLSEWEQQQIKGRLAKLTNGVAVIRVGGQTEVEMKERKERCDDAVCATQAAITHGLVPGGETVYLSVLSELDDTILGERILKQALRQPFQRLLENAGLDAGEYREKLRHTKGTKGVDVRTGEIKDMIAEGIVDPAAVPTTAISTAVSVAVQLSSLGAAAVRDNEETHN